MFEIKNLSKKYTTNYVLRDINLLLKPGTIHILLGSSGVGKSTLLRVLNDLESIDSGSVFYNGNLVDISTMHEQHLIGFVFQNFGLFKHLSARENITLVLEKVIKLGKDEAQKKADILLDQFGLLQQAHLSVSKLSGGQKQRLAIARALSVDPRIICMDEPTSALDPLLTKHVAHQIQSLADKGYTLLISTHDMSLIENIDCVVHLMAAGSIKESADSRELKNNPKQFEYIYNFMSGDCSNLRD